MPFGDDEEKKCRGQAGKEPITSEDMTTCEIKNIIKRCVVCAAKVGHKIHTRGPIGLPLSSLSWA